MGCVPKRAFSNIQHFNLAHDKLLNLKMKILKVLNDTSWRRSSVVRLILLQLDLLQNWVIQVMLSPWGGKFMDLSQMQRHCQTKKQARAFKYILIYLKGIFYPCDSWDVYVPVCIMYLPIWGHNQWCEKWKCEYVNSKNMLVLNPQQICGFRDFPFSSAQGHFKSFLSPWQGEPSLWGGVVYSHYWHRESELCVIL